jgi:hypothetical protein
MNCQWPKHCSNADPLQRPDGAPERKENGFAMNGSLFSSMVLSRSHLLLMTMWGLGWLSLPLSTQTSWAIPHPATSIIGGVAIAARDPIASSTVALLSLEAEGASICTGSIIAEDLILTAAHCLGPILRPTLIFFSQNVEGKADHVTYATQSLRHFEYGEGYDRHRDEDMNDIGLIRFKGGLPLGYAPAQLLTQAEAGALQDGNPITLAGFGREIGDVRKHKGPNGAGVLRKVETTIFRAQHGDTEILTEQSRGKGACHGDSGGPAFVRAPNGQLKIFGVTSRGPAGAPDDCSSFGIYTQTLAHLDFIEEAAFAMREYGWTD